MGAGQGTGDAEGGGGGVMSDKREINRESQQERMGCCGPHIDDYGNLHSCSAFAEADQAHPVPDWMADQEAVKQAKEEMEQARQARAQALADANGVLRRAIVAAKKRLAIYKGSFDPCNEQEWHINAHTCARHLQAVVEALDRLEEVERL